MAGTTRKTETAARTCGMSVEQWSQVKTQAHHARTRGRRAEAAKKLASWGAVAGQEALFDTYDTTTD